MKTDIFLKAEIKDGKIFHPIKAQETRLNKFLASLPDGARVELFIGISTGKGSHAQLAKVHAMCKEIANEVGYTFEEVKLQAKRQAGLCITRNNTEFCKSFADCDTQDLNAVIQTLIEIGDFAGMNLR